METIKALMQLRRTDAWKFLDAITWHLDHNSPVVPALWDMVLSKQEGVRTAYDYRDTCLIVNGTQRYWSMYDELETYVLEKYEEYEQCNRDLAEAIAEALKDW